MNVFLIIFISIQTVFFIWYIIRSLKINKELKQMNKDFDEIFEHVEKLRSFLVLD